MKPTTQDVDRAVPPSANDTSSSLRPFYIACCVFLVTLEVLGFFLTKNLSNSPDFRAFYSAGYLLRHNPPHLFDLAAQKQIQDSLISPAATSLPFYHPSYEAILFLPLSFLPFRVAYLAFIAVNILLLVAALRASHPLFLRPIPFLQPRPGLIFFLFAPLILAIMQGQDAILFLLLCAAAWRLLESNRDTAAGVVLALALFRLQLALPLAILLAIRRGWRFALSFLGAAVAVALLCVALTGWTGTVALVRVLQGASLSGDQSAAFQNVMGIHPLAAPNLAGLLAALGTVKLSAHAAFVISLIGSLAVFAVAAYRIRSAVNLASAFALAVMSSLLVSQHANPHDATILLIPVAFITTGISSYLMLTIYYLPAILLLFFGADTFFLLAVPQLLVLFFPLRETHAVNPS